ncbi:MAG: 4-hydroxybenzoate octaprenyltransferase, partial [Devosiaceae bacterium]|nr:4-hydroxybenzoate octaprenyltransferase [Devosiaceae bacterium MH13]
GIGSSAQAVGTAAPTFVGACFALTIVILALAYVSVGVGIPAYLGLLAAAAHFVWQLRTLDITDPDGCRRLFQSNAQVGGLIALGLLADVFV